MRTLILLASRGEAKFFEKDGGKDLTWVKTIKNNKGRRRESEFHWDLPGESFGKIKGHLGPHRLEQKVDHTTLVALKFAKRIAGEIQNAYVNKSFDKAVLYASPKLLGFIKAELGKLAKRADLEFIAKNIEKASSTQILAQI